MDANLSKIFQNEPTITDVVKTKVKDLITKLDSIESIELDGTVEVSDTVAYTCTSLGKTECVFTTKIPESKTNTIARIETVSVPIPMNYIGVTKYPANSNIVLKLLQSDGSDATGDFNITLLSDYIAFGNMSTSIGVSGTGTVTLPVVILAPEFRNLNNVEFDIGIVAPTEYVLAADDIESIHITSFDIVRVYYYVAEGSNLVKVSRSLMIADL